MHKKNRIQGAFLTLLLLFPLANVQAQFTMQGTDPASIHWNRWDRAGINMVYPDFKESSVSIFQEVLLKNRGALGLSMKATDKPFPVLFHPYAPCNGLVVWTPKRMEINLSPPLDGSAQPWIEQLALHEYRHVKQMEVLGSGLAKVGYPFFGEIALGVMSAFVPRWLYEGDAVMMETAWSKTGRGRLAEFDMPMRALLADTSLHYSYDKLLLGSEKDFVPDPYVYGYHFAAYMREHYGSDIWDKVIRYVSWRPFLVHPKSFALKKYTGHWQKTLQDRAWKEWKDTWANRAPGSEQAEKKAVDRLNHFEPENFVSCSEAFAMPDSALVYFLSDRKNLGRWIRRNPFGKSYTVYVPGTRYTKTVCSDPFLAWGEAVPHPRYEQSTLSELRCLHIYTKELLKLDTRYWNRVQALTFGENLDLWVLSLTDEGNYRLECVNLNHIPLKQIKPITRKDIRYAYTWTPVGQERVTDMFNIDSLSVGFLTANETGMHLEAFRLRDSTRTSLMGRDEQWNSMRHTTGTGDQVLFTSDQTGVENVFAYSFRDSAVYRLTNAQFGAYYPVWDTVANMLWVTDYTSKGEQLLAFPKDSCMWEKTDFSKRPSFPMADLLARQEQQLASGLTEDARVQNQKTSPESYHGPYRGFSRSLNLHSWAPVFFDPSSFPEGSLSESLNPGATIMSQNLLGNLYGNLGYVYMNQRNTLHTSISYRRFWPILSVSAHFNERQRMSHSSCSIVNGGEIVETDTLRTDHTPSMELNAAITFPYQKSRGAFNYGVVGQFMWSVDNERLDKDLSRDISYGSLSYTDVVLLCYIQQKMALRDIYPQLGLQLSTRYRRHDCGTQQYNFVVSGWLPGGGDNHSLRLSIAYEHQTASPYFFSMMMQRLRVMSPSPNYQSSYFISRADYTLPLGYPDFRIPTLLYIKKFYLNLFGEFGRNPEDFQSVRYGAGADVWSEFHILHFGYPFQAGLRTACDLTHTPEWNFQLMFALPF